MDNGIGRGTYSLCVGGGNLPCQRPILLMPFILMMRFGTAPDFPTWNYKGPFPNFPHSLNTLSKS